MKPIIHLLGDSFKARSFLWFAEKKLAEMKTVMGLINTKFGNKSYRLPDGSVQVYVESYLGVDKIRIIAVSEEVIPGTVASLTLPVNNFVLGNVFNTSVTPSFNAQYIWTTSELSGQIDWTTTLKIWDESGNVLASVGPFNHSEASGVPLVDTYTVPTTLFLSRARSYYYGAQFDYVSGDDKVVNQIPTPGIDQSRIWNGSEFVASGLYGCETAFGTNWVGNGANTVTNGTITICSSTVTGTIIANKVDADTIVYRGANVGKELQEL